MLIRSPVPPSSSESGALLVKGLSYALVGRPNCGKTTLFNALTGLRQKVGNYPGVTVEKRYGSFTSPHGLALQVLDLPGANSLSPQSPDEAILRDVLFGYLPDRVDRILCVIDLESLERSLYFALQVLELAKPTIVVLNQSTQRNITLNQLKALEGFLGVPVLVYKERDRSTLVRLKVWMSKAELPKRQGLFAASGPLKQSVEQVQAIVGTSPAEALAYLEGSTLEANVPAIVQEQLAPIQGALQEAEPDWQAHCIQQRYACIDVFLQAQHFIKQPLSQTLSYKLDQWVLHPILGWVTLAAVFMGMFMGVFSVSIYPMRLLERGFDAMQSYLSLIPPSTMRDLLCDGLLAGLANVVLFLPQILMLFFFIGVLELSGYLPRAIFLLDGPMRKVGLQGRSFIPLLSSYGCAIPGILATRTIGSWPERLTTVLIAPWMSCSARLPIYLIFIGVLFPSPLVPAWQKAGLLMAAYALSTLAALGVAACLRKCLLKGEKKDMLMELPPYQWPSFSTLAFSLYDKVRGFFTHTAPFILAFSVVFWFMSHYPRPQASQALSSQGPQALSTAQGPSIEGSYIGSLGKALEPIFEPLGYDWRVSISILSSFAARELFISTLGIIYHIEDKDQPVQDCGCGCCGTSPATRARFSSVLLSQKDTDGQRFYTPLRCLSLIVFYMFALQCTSTLAIVRKETGSWRWPVLQFVFMTAFAYLSALCVYQCGRYLGFS